MGGPENENRPGNLPGNYQETKLHTMVILEETNDENLNVLMPFSLGTKPLKILSIGQHVGGFKHHLNGYFVVFFGACSLK